MAKQYHKLPSEIRAKATVFDIEVYSCMMSWEEQQQQVAQGRPRIPKLTQEEMLKMMERAKQYAGKDK